MKKVIVIIFTSFIVLSACGQMGPLYLPEKDTSDKKNSEPLDKPELSSESKKSS